jgi:hypothetical protein
MTKFKKVKVTYTVECWVNEELDESTAKEVATEVALEDLGNRMWDEYSVNITDETMVQDD